MSGTLVIPDENGILPEAGTFYISTESTFLNAGTIRIDEPPHQAIENTVQISLRPDNSYTGYLCELINTPFIMAPRATPNGFNQADTRLGTDCAGLAVYGRRRMGYTDVHYLGPAGILHFRSQVSVFFPVQESKRRVFLKRISAREGGLQLKQLMSP